MKSNSKKYPLPTGEQWSRLPERVQALEQAKPVAPYKVFTALLTQSGNDNVVSINTGSLVKGVTYQVNGTGGGNENFLNVGLPFFYDGAYFVATENAEPNNWDGCNLLYNTGAPIAIVLENTIGNVWFGYTSVGTYSINSNSLFPEAKIYGNVSQRGGYNFSIEIGGGGSNSARQISTYDDTGVLTNNLLGFNAIEIRVYN